MQIDAPPDEDTQQPFDLLHRRAQIDESRCLLSLLPGEAHQAIRERSGLARREGHVGDRLRLGARREPVLQATGGRQDDGEGVVQVVHEPRSERRREVHSFRSYDRGLHGLEVPRSFAHPRFEQAVRLAQLFEQNELPGQQHGRQPQERESRTDESLPMP